MKKNLGLAKLVLSLPLAFAFTSCAYQKATLDQKLEAEVSTADKGLIPTAAFFNDKQFRNFKISPDGKYLAAMFSENGRKVLGIVSPDLTKLHTVIRFQGNLDVQTYQWVNNERLAVMAAETFGNLDGRQGRGQYFFMNYDGTKFKDFFSKEWAGFDIISLTPDDPETIVMAKYHARDRGKPVAIKFNVYNGQSNTLAIPPMDATSILANEAGEANVSMITDFKEDFDKAEISVKLNGKWETIVYPATGGTYIKPIYLDEKESTLYVLSDRETGRSAVYAFNLKTKVSKPVFAHESVDVEDLIMENGKIVGLIFENGRPEIIILDKDSPKMKLIKELQSAFPDQLVTNLSMTTDKKTAVFKVQSDRNPGNYYMVDVPTLKVRALASEMPELANSPLGPREPFTMKARDKMELHGYVTLPPNKTMKDKLPMIVSVHGGPFGVKDGWFYRADEQYFASRGYAVLQVNYRGSGGFGYKFEEAGYKQWGKAMQDDVTDATKWAIEQGIADPDRICIFGGSYGGYAALQGVTKEPDLYKCAVSYVGVSNLTLKTEFGDASRMNSGQKFLKKTLGDDMKELAQYSPALNADRIKAPIFIIHGEDDVRVPLIHAKSMREGLDKHKKVYQWMVKPSEGHGFTQPANKIEAYHEMIKFFDKYIGKDRVAAKAP